MLNSETIAIIKSTVPVLEVHGNAITTRFYQLLFENHPELLNIFNHANQKQGRQQTALANAVYAAAKNIDQLETIIPVVKQIGHKHRSLGIKAEHYPIVGKHLLMAIKDVLGDAATDEIINAWAEAYGVIADAFISVEHEMYVAAEQQKGGWADFRTFVVYKKVEESNVITSFYLKPVDGQSIASFIPGQYISVKVNIPGDDYTHIRQYSLSDAPGQDYYRISVKREDSLNDKPNGKVSTYLHQNIKVGDTLEVSAPAGDFVLDTESSEPLVLLSGGVGLTPMMSMLNTTLANQPERSVSFVHAAISGEYQAFGEYVKELDKRHDSLSAYVCYEKPTADDIAKQQYNKAGYIDLEFLQANVDKQSVFYVCGPVPFMKAMYQALKQWGVQDNKIHYEFFGPAMSM
ncbi:NO-inducible flavohemoprotein [Paenibacillus sp. IITD108]|uniref:NO-inducible flavohemoprotein n=1 Tax=Paenibacillus sp. IITD108 TaxID=3116649 RepID=UPI002F40EAF4